MGGRRESGNLEPTSLRMASAEAEFVTKNEAGVEVD